ncbi:unnamed protein product [Diatraea saccharalis]|uniref:Zinc finger PHD-type domain-containing protein n=1 Tax=Diatraea saccharalis TaxID=40085 RepID=A0A9N9QVZ8_9NEOP|nr:unnamed protein product [Diatraea saccharalis]
MSNVKKVCNGCRSAIEDRRYLRCSNCQLFYDLVCANVSEQRFYNTMTVDHKAQWRCVLCMSLQPKFDNTKTPIRVASTEVTMREGAAVATSPLALDVLAVEQPPSLTDTLNDTAHNVTIEITDFQSFVMEMRAFREEIREEIRANRLEAKRLNDSVVMLANRIDNCESGIKKLNERIDQLEVSPPPARDDVSSLSSEIDQLKTELNDRNQELLLTDIELTCIPEQKEESLLHIVSVVATKLGVDLSEQDIVSAARMGRTIDATQSYAIPRPRPIVVRLARRATRDKLLEAAKVRRGATTENMGFSGKTCRFFINERLTKHYYA